MRSSFNLNQYLNPVQPFVCIILLKIFIAGIFLPTLLSNITLLSLLFLWFISGDFKHCVRQLLKKKLLILLIGFYILHIIGLLYSDNLYSAYKELEKKIPLLLLPVIIASVNDETLADRRTEFFIFYVRVTAAACVLLVLYALYRYAGGADHEVFYFKEFTSLIQVNPIYLAMYVLFAFGIYFYEINQGNRVRDWVTKGIVYLLTTVVLVFISSKTGLIVFILFSMHIIFSQLKNFKKIYRAAAALAAVLLVVATINYFPVTRERLQNVFESDWSALWDKDHPKNASTFTGFTMRVSFWKVALYELAEDGLLLQGVGTGDYLDYLNKAFEKNGLVAAGYTNFNLHNAFMDVVLEFGVIGLVFYLFIWIMIAICAIRNKNTPLILLLVIFFFFSFTESILYVNKGLVFFSFWVSICLNWIYIHKGSALLYRREGSLSPGP